MPRNQIVFISFFCVFLPLFVTSQPLENYYNESDPNKLCSILNNNVTETVFILAPVTFEGPCLLTLISRGLVSIQCVPNGLASPHFQCPYGLPCFASDSMSVNSTIEVSGCSILGGGFIEIMDALVNITIADCNFTTLKSSSRAFLLFKLLRVPTHIAFFAVRIQIVNMQFTNISFNGHATCIRIFFTNQTQGGMVLALQDITISNITSSVVPISVGQIDDDSPDVPGMTIVDFKNIRISNSVVSIPHAVGAISLRNVTGFMSDISCLRCRGRSFTKDPITNEKPALSGCLAVMYGTDLHISSFLSDECSGDRSGALYFSDSSITFERMKVIRSSNTERPFRALTVKDNGFLRVQELVVEDSDGVLYALYATTVEIENFRVIRSSGTQINYDSYLTINSFHSSHVYSNHSGGVFEVYGNSTATITSCLIENSTAKQTIVAHNDSTVRIASMTARNVTSVLNGGVFAIYDNAALYVGELTVTDTTSLQGGGGVLYCNTNRVCDIGGVVAIQNAKSYDAGGVVLVDNGNVVVTCKQNAGAITGASSTFGGCFSVRQNLPSLTIKDCDVKACLSCGSPTYHNFLMAPKSARKDSILILNNTIPFDMSMYVRSQEAVVLVTSTKQQAAGTPLISTKVPQSCANVTNANIVSTVSQQANSKPSSETETSVLIASGFGVLSGSNAPSTSIPTLVGVLDSQCSGDNAKNGSSTTAKSFWVLSPMFVMAGPFQNSETSVSFCAQAVFWNGITAIACFAGHRVFVLLSKSEGDVAVPVTGIGMLLQGTMYCATKHLSLHGGEWILIDVFVIVIGPLCGVVVLVVLPFLWIYRNADSHEYTNYVPTTPCVHRVLFPRGWWSPSMMYSVFIENSIPEMRYSYVCDTLLAIYLGLVTGFQPTNSNPLACDTVAWLSVAGLCIYGVYLMRYRPTRCVTMSYLRLMSLTCDALVIVFGMSIREVDVVERVAWVSIALSLCYSCTGACGVVYEYMNQRRLACATLENASAVSTTEDHNQQSAWIKPPIITSQELVEL
eukprot:PhF_6_TR40498/c0_g1_i4/m.60601